MENEGRLRILQVHNYYQISGGEDTVVENERKLLEEHGHTVIQYTRNNRELKEFSALSKILLPFITIFNPKTYRDIKKIVKKEKIDIVHVHNTLNLISPAVYYAALKCNVPVVQTVHNFRLLCPGATFYRDRHICEDCVEYGLKCAIKHGCYRGSRVQTLVCVISTWLHRFLGVYGKINYICLTEFNKEKLLQLRKINAEQVFIKPNFTQKCEKTKKPGKFYLYIGRIEEIKGIWILINVFANMPEIELVIAGAGALSDRIEMKIKDGNLKNIRYVGFLKRSELENLLSEAKAVIVPSQWLEPFGMTVIEAFAMGVPVIAGDIGSLQWLVENGRNGFKFTYNSDIQLSDAIRKMEIVCSNKDAEQKMQIEALATFENNFSENRNAEILMDIYHKAQ